MLIDRASFFLMCRRRILARYRHTSSGFKRIIGRPDNAWAVKAEGVSLAAMAAPLDSAPLRLRAAQGLLTNT